MTFARLRDAVRAELGQHHRYAHSVRVARLAETLARVHEADASNARLAGMLHDIARLYSEEDLIAQCERRGVSIDSFARQHPIVLHAPLGARLAQERFGVSDPEVLSAIAKHTLGARDMSLADCVLYLADALEPGRRFEERAALLDLSMRDLGAGMAATIRSSLRYLHERRLRPAPQTLEMLRTVEESTGGHR